MSRSLHKQVNSTKEPKEYLLSEVPVHSLVKVIGYCTDCAYSRRLIEMGVVPGKIFRYERDAPLGDPLEIKEEDTCSCGISLRKGLASMIMVELLEEKPTDSQQ